MSGQGTGEMGSLYLRWGDSELQEMELRLETKLREIVGSGVQWLVRQLDEGMTDIRREMQGMKDEMQEIADRVCETNEKVGWLACQCAGQKRQFEKQLEQQIAAVMRMNEEVQRAAEECGQGMRKVGDMGAMQGQMMKGVEAMMKGMGEQIAPHVRNGMERVMGEHEDVVRSRHREMKGKLDELQAQLRRGFGMGSGGLDGGSKGEQMGDDMSDDSMSAAATVLAAAGGGMKEREGVRESQYGGGAQYFAGPPMQ
jgi:chromosome segregation ATPase